MQLVGFLLVAREGRGRGTELVDYNFLNYLLMLRVMVYYPNDLSDLYRHLYSINILQHLNVKASPFCGRSVAP